jgi:hypothetical protein
MIESDGIQPQPAMILTQSSKVVNTDGWTVWLSMTSFRHFRLSLRVLQPDSRNGDLVEPNMGTPGLPRSAKHKRSGTGCRSLRWRDLGHGRRRAVEMWKSCKYPESPLFYFLNVFLRLYCCSLIPLNT